MANLRQEQLIYLQQLQLKGDDGFVGDLSASTLINNSSDNNIPFQHHRASYSSTFVPSAPSIHPTKAIVPHPPSTINKSTTLQSRKPPPSITPHTSLSFKSSSLSNSSASTSTALQESRTVVREMLGDSLTSVEQLFVDQLLNSTAISGGGVINVAAVESSASKSSASSSASVDLTSFIQQPQPQQQQFIFPDQFKRYSYTNNSSAMLPSSFSSSVEDEGLPANSLPLLENDGDQMKLDDWIFDDIYNFNTGI